MEYTFEKPSETPYVLMPFIFEPGREALFKLTILSDDRDDDGIPDFGFEEIKPENDWKQTCLMDGWSTDDSMTGDDNRGGPVPADGAQPGSWSRNPQFQITTYEASTRCFLFLEMHDIDTDMRQKEGLQEEPDYPTVGFVVCQGLGDHHALDETKCQILNQVPLKRGDGVYFEFVLPKSENKHVIIPYTDVPGVDHKFALTLYTDHKHLFEKIDPNKCHIPCTQCSEPSGMARVLSKLSELEAKHKLLLTRENALRMRGGFPTRQGSSVGAYAGGGGVPAPGSSNFMAADANHDGLVDRREFANFQRQQALFTSADRDGDGIISKAELADYTQRVQEHAEAQHAQYLAALQAAQEESDALRHQLEAARGGGGGTGGDKDKSSSLCSVM